MTTTKRQTGIRLSQDTEKTLQLLREDTGLTTTAVIELAVRDMAKARGLSERVRENRPTEEQVAGELSDARQAALLSERALSKIWNTPEEDAAWAHL